MNRRLVTILAAGVLVAGGLFAPACTRGGKKAATDSTGTVGSPDCYQTAGAQPCPPDRSDPSGKMLPTPGGVCTLGACKMCGSARAPAYRDATGAAQAGFCICVQQSDDTGVSVYSCRSVAEWSQVLP